MKIEEKIKKEFNNVTIGELKRFMGNYPIGISDHTFDSPMRRLEALQGEIDHFLSPPDYSEFLTIFDNFMKQKIPFKHAYDAARIVCEQTNASVPYRYAVRHRLRAMRKAGE